MEKKEQDDQDKIGSNHYTQETTTLFREERETEQDSEDKAITGFIGSNWMNSVLAHRNHPNAGLVQCIILAMVTACVTMISVAGPTVSDALFCHSIHLGNHTYCNNSHCLHSIHSKQRFSASTTAAVPSIWISRKNS